MACTFPLMDSGLLPLLRMYCPMRVLLMEAVSWPGSLLSPAEPPAEQRASRDGQHHPEGRPADDRAERDKKRAAHAPHNRARQPAYPSPEDAQENDGRDNASEGAADGTTESRQQRSTHPADKGTAA